MKCALHRWIRRNVKFGCAPRLAAAFAALCLSGPLAPASAQSTSADAALLAATLTTAAGVPVEGDVSVTVRAYTSPAGPGAPVYEEIFSANISNGELSLPLGGKVEFPSDLLLTERLWLGVSVEGDAEMTPRLEVGAVPVAWRSVDAETVGGLAPNDLALASQNCPEGEVARAIDSKGLLLCSALSQVAFSGEYGDLLNVLPPVQLGVAPPIANQPGELFFNTEDAELFVWTGSKWQLVNAGANGLTLPFSGGATTTNYGFRVTQLGTGAAIVGRSFSDSVGSGLYGEAGGSLTAAVRGHSNTSSGFSAYFTGARAYFQGPVGVGIELPSAPLQVQGAGGAAAIFTNTSGGAGSSAIDAETQSPGGRAIFGWASNGNGAPTGVWGRIDAGAGSGVRGESTNAGGSASAVGVEGTTASPLGSGVRGIGPAGGSGSGVLGQSSSATGRGVTGNNTATTGNAVGVAASSAGSTGRAVLATATDAIGATFGVHSTANSTNGTGVFGHAAASTGPGTSTGVHGRADSPTGRGVFGQATATSGSATGVVGESSGSTGVGVLGQATAGSGVGVLGQATASSGSTTGVRGTVSSSSGRGVEGLSTAGTGVGVYGQATSGKGVFGVATATSGQGQPEGVRGEASHPNGRGVVGVYNSTTGSGVGVYARSLSSDPSSFALVAESTQGTSLNAVNSVDAVAANVESFYAEGGVSPTLKVTRHSPNGFAIDASALGTWPSQFGTSAGDGGGVFGEGRRVGVMGRTPNLNGTAVQAVVRGFNGSPFDPPEASFGFRQINDVAAANQPGKNLFEGRLTVMAGWQGQANTTFGLYVAAGDAAKPGGGMWATPSDKRLKRDIRPLVGALARLLSLEGMTYEYTQEAIANHGGLAGTQIGLIAQKVREIFPEWVGTGTDGYMYVSEKGVVALFVEALRELRAESQAAVQLLEAENRALRQENDALHRRLDAIEARLNSLSPQ